MITLWYYISDIEYALIYLNAYISVYKQEIRIDTPTPQNSHHQQLVTSSNYVWIYKCIYVYTPYCAGDKNGLTACKTNILSILLSVQNTLSMTQWPKLNKIILLMILFYNILLYYQSWYLYWKYKGITALINTFVYDSNFTTSQKFYSWKII